jgi:hypothetical protein
MGYTLRIGEAVVDKDDEDFLTTTVLKQEHPEAPALDQHNPRKNTCWPSYSQWARFAREVGLEQLFFGDGDKGAHPEGPTDRVGLLQPHPGCRRITTAHRDTVREAIADYRRRYPTAEPGWDPAYDNFGDLKPGASPDSKWSPDLARLTWLEWWMTWALANCTVPAFYNN